MARTNELRALIETRLGPIKTTYNLADNAITYRVASDKTMFPHIVFYLDSMTPTDMGREDYVLDVDIWTKGDQTTAADIADSVVDLLSFRNDPQQNILPTIYLTSVGNIEDPDKTLCHTVVRFDVQNYRRT